MAGQMTHRERTWPPISMWRHFYDRESSPEGLAEAMLGFQHRSNLVQATPQELAGEVRGMQVAMGKKG